MPGVYQWSIDRVNEEIDELLAAGIDKIILFGIPAEKDSTGSDSYSSNGIIQQSLKKLKQKYPDLFIITDVCFCEYTDHGHCGVIEGKDVQNDSTLSLLGQQALSHVKAGADMVAPSCMMDGMVGEIRFALDTGGFDHIPIMSYAVKYGSAFYGPFRDAVDSEPQFGDRKSYQMDPANINEALKEVELDILEGADIIMVKPALAYLDVISHVKEISNLPVACYNVSGEYSMLKAAAEKGWIDHDSAIMEMLLSMKRAGADIIISYFAKEAAQLINNDK
jgi:porphobilinogen synthase